MTLSTQNNHKHDAQVNIPRSTEKNVDSSKEKAKNNGLSKKAAASKAVSEVDAIQTKSSLQSSVSENNFDTKLKNNVRVEGKSSKHKTVDTDGIQFLFANKPHGKTGSSANSNLKCGAIEKTFAPVSAVRSLNSPIHQKPQPISDTVTPEVDFSHTASLYQPPLTNSSVQHAKRMDLVPLSKSKANEKEIADIIYKYGEERASRRIAKAIVAFREKIPIDSTKQLSDIVCKTIPNKKSQIHPATKTFQAFRIYINHELDEIKEVLPQATDVLCVGGRLAIISFHSLEDRIVKRFLRDQSKPIEQPLEIPLQKENLGIKLKLIGKKVRPSEKEVSNNPRSRSALLRVAERC